MNQCGHCCAGVISDSEITPIPAAISLNSDHTKQWSEYLQMFSSTRAFFFCLIRKSSRRQLAAQEKMSSRLHPSSVRLYKAMMRQTRRFKPEVGSYYRDHVRAVSDWEMVDELPEFWVGRNSEKGISSYHRYI
tara:strand:- start:99 stop:497 length:399 start_codon:yes stop_codon:yes gene_type:complete